MVNRKSMAWLAITAAAVIASLSSWVELAPVNKHSPVPSISYIQTVSELATLRVQISDYIVGENKNWQVRWLLHGEAVLGIDLSKAHYISIDEQNRMLTLSLPAVHVVSSKVDHHRSAEIGVKQKTWIMLPGLKSLRDEVWQHADKKIAKLARNEEYFEATRIQTENALSRLFQDCGWSVSFEWETKTE
jgi:hypothetical protein